MLYRTRMNPQAKTYRENEEYTTKDGTQIKEPWTGEILDHFSKKMKERTRIALEVQSGETALYRCFFYKMLLTGRRCSCWGVETSPDGFCEVCWGTGCVGGFEKYGCRTEVIDVTRSTLIMVNVLPALHLQIRPVPFILLDSATKGYIETEVDLRANRGILDYIGLGSSQPGGSSVSSWVRTTSETSLVRLTKESLTARLGADRLVFRIFLQRTSPEDDQPTVSHLMFRYQIRSKITVNIDFPIQTESILLSELGVMDAYNTIPLGFDSTLKTIGPEDFVMREGDQRRFKIIEAEKFAPMGRLVSWQVSGRHVHSYEKYSRFPT